MSKQSDNPRDSRVSSVYRAIADERAPQHLNETVLRMAATGARTPYARARAWLRPAAWAATIGLSLALVLELTRLPQESLPYDGAPADAASSELYQRDSTQPAEDSKVVESTGVTPDKAPLDEKWRARELPAKAVPAPAMLDQEIRGDDTADAPHFLCPADVRDSADRWYDCIETLHESLPPNQIAVELEKLVAAYPDFVAPEE